MKKLLSFILLACSLPIFGMQDGAAALSAAPAATIVRLQAADGGTCEVDSATLNSHLVDNALRLAQGSETIAVPVAPTQAVLQSALDVHNAKQTSDLDALVAHVPSADLVQILNTYEFLFGHTGWQSNAQFFNRFQSPDINFTFFAQAILDKIVHELGAQPLGEHSPHGFLSEVDENDAVLWRFIEHQFQTDVVNNSPWRYQGFSNPNGHIEYVWFSAWSPDGQTLATSSYDYTAKLWRPDGTLIATLGGPNGHTNGILALTWSPDGQILATGSEDHTVKFWRPDGTLIATLGGHDGHTDAVWALTWSSDGNRLATGSYDHTVKLWHANGTLVATLGNRDAPANRIHSFIWSPDGQILATSGEASSVKLWRADGTLIATLAHGNRSTPASWSPDGQTLATYSEGDHTIKLWRANGSPITTLNTTSRIFSVNWSPDGQPLATHGLDDNTVKLWRPDGALISSLDHASSIVISMAWSPDGQILATSSSDSTAKLWRPDGALISSLDHASIVISIAWSPDGHILATGLHDNTVSLWRPNGALICILSDPNGDQSSIGSLSWSTDGQMLARSEDRRVKFWRHMAPVHANLSTLQKLLLLKFFKQKTLTPAELNNLQPLLDSLPASAAAFIAQCAEQQS